MLLTFRLNMDILVQNKTLYIMKLLSLGDIDAEDSFAVTLTEKLNNRGIPPCASQVAIH